MQLIKYFNTFIRYAINLPQGRFDERVGRGESIYGMPENEV